MTIYIGSDHGGFNLKGHLKEVLKSAGHKVTDMGALELVKDDDYAPYAVAVAQKVAEAPAEALGIVICRSGFGVDIAANKIKGIRSALAMSPEHIYQGRHDDDVNVLALAADFVDESAAEKIVKMFLTTPFAKEERYSRRLHEIKKIELHN